MRTRRARPPDEHPTDRDIPMKKLALKLDDLNVQSFATTSAMQELRCTVRGYLDDASHDECSDACGSYIYTCDACEETGDGGTGGDHEQQRRIILY